MRYFSPTLPTAVPNLGKACVRFRTARYPLPPPIPNHALRRFRARPVITIERSSRDVVIELRAVVCSLLLKIVKDFFRRSARIGQRLHHRRRHRTNHNRGKKLIFAGISLEVCAAFRLSLPWERGSTPMWRLTPPEHSARPSGNLDYCACYRRPHCLGLHDVDGGNPQRQCATGGRRGLRGYGHGLG
jgi:hypothetical protein